MIDEIATFICYGYTSDELSLNSHKGIIAICKDCGNIRLLKFQDYRDLCKSCILKRRNITEKQRKIVSCSQIGRKHTEESKRKMRENHIDVFGSNNPNWNPNLTSTDREIDRKYPEYTKWRKEIYERDNYTCQICGKIGGILNAHHIEGYAKNPSLRTTLSNGITLCEKHHKDFHHQYGKGNNTKEQFIEFIGVIK